MHTPNDIEVLIHYYCSPERHPREEAPAVQETIEKFLAIGIFAITERVPGYCVTDKGKAWIEMILSTPYPELQWVHPEKKTIIKFK